MKYFFNSIHKKFSIDIFFLSIIVQIFVRGHHGHDRMVAGFTTTCAIIAYHY